MGEVTNAQATARVEPKPQIERRRSRGYRGEVVYIYAFDVALGMQDLPISHLLGQTVTEFGIGQDKRSPREFSFYKPQMVKLPVQERVGPTGLVKVYRTIKLLPLGAVSITVRLPFEVDDLLHLVQFHDLEFEDGSLHREVRHLAEQVVDELKTYYIKPHLPLVEEEAYTIFCLESPLVDEEGKIISAESWFKLHRREIAAVLTQEKDPSVLSDQEAEESTSMYLSYYKDDLVVVDWDAALIVDDPAEFDESIYIFELANLQLSELEAYDRILDETLEQAYDDLSGKSLRSRRAILRDLKELRIDLTRFSDELQNITKFFGDWHLARVYERIARRFHLNEWHAAIDDKLRTLDSLYHLAAQEQDTRTMVWLETAIVVLFVLDVIIILLGVHI